METEKVYAKNPGDEYLGNPGEIILDNPSNKKSKSKAAKDPRRVAAGKKAWKTRQNKKKKNNDMSKKRSNPNSIADTGLKMYKQYGAAALGTIFALSGVSYAMRKFGSGLPDNVKEYAPIVVPGVVGVAIATRAKKKNAALQGVAGGMVYNSAFQAIQKLLPDEVTGDLSGALDYNKSSLLADIPQGSVVVTPEGMLLDTEGNPIRRAQASLPAASSKSKGRKAFSGMEERDTFGFETAEQF
ncbi:MAG: hypothetical protein WEA58_04010 [Balneolaceae bacterium]